MIPTPNSFTDINDWVSQLEFDHIISLLYYSQSNATNLEKIHINKTLRDLFNNLQVIKQYYNTKKRTPEQTMFDNIIMPHTILKSRSKQRSKRSKNLRKILMEFIKIVVDHNVKCVLMVVLIQINSY